MTLEPELYEIFYKNLDQFTRKLYLMLRKTDENFAISPLSVYMCMALIYCGASGNTATELVKGLPLPTKDKRKIGQLFGNIRDDLKKVPELHVACNLFLNHDVRLKLEFLDFARDYFHIDPHVINFRSHVACARRINDFGYLTTGGVIDRICDRRDITPNMRMVAASIFTYNGEWKRPFLRYETARDKFWKTANNSIEVDMMSSKDNYQYLYSAKLDAEILQLEYVVKNMSLIVVLPTKGYDLTDVEKRLSDVELSSVTSEMNSRPLIVKLPVFSLSVAYKFGEKLAEIGMGKMFSFDAEFKDLCSKGNEHLDRFFEKTVFKVDEGLEERPNTYTKAAKSSSKVQRDTFNANHPFLFFLKYDHFILCIGRYAGH